MAESSEADRSNFSKSFTSDRTEDSGYSSNLSEISESFRHLSPVNNFTPVIYPNSGNTLNSNDFKSYQYCSVPRFNTLSPFQCSPCFSPSFTSAGKRSTHEECGSALKVEVNATKKFRSNPDRETDSVSKNSIPEAPGSTESKLFVSTPYSNYLDYIDRLQSTPSPVVKTTLIGRSHVDFLYFLGVRGVHNPVLQKIFSYLSDQDLCIASCVSKTWQQIITSDDVCNKRVTNFFCRPMKENVAPASTVLKSCEDDALPPLNLVRRVRLMEIQNREGSAQNVQNQNKGTPTNKSPPVSPSKVRFHLFRKEAQKLDPGEQLVQCPRCSLPSRQDKANNLGSCTRQGCQYQFCLSCYREFHQPHSCSFLTPRYSRSNSTINGKKASRRFLRRL